METEALLFSILRAEMQCLVPENLNTDVSAKVELESVFQLSRSHGLTSFVGQGLSRMGVLGDDDLSKKFKNSAMRAFYRYVQMNQEYEQICKTLEEACILFIPLKGSVIRDYYPEPWMRTSSDIDILVHESDLDRAIGVLTEKLSYINKGRSYHDVSLFSPSGVHLELHFDMIEEGTANSDCRAVLSKVWEHTKPKEGKTYHLCMSDEMFYFYHIAHMAKHLLAGECGIRPFLDLWILNHKIEYDRQGRETLLAKGRFLTFAKIAEQLSEAWFSAAPMDDHAACLGEFVLHGGVRESKAAIQQARTGNRFSYLIKRRLFMPYVFMKVRYPVLQKHKWLLTVYQVVRWVQMLRKGGMRRSLHELKANAEISTEQISSTAELLEYLGL